MRIGMKDAARQNDDERLVILAEIGAAHGIRGEVRVRSHTADPLAFSRYGPLTGSDGRSYEVTAARLAKDMVITRLNGVADRTAAEKLNGVTLAVKRSALPHDEDEEEYYHADLLGLAAVDATGHVWGTVTAIHDFGAGDLIEITAPDRRTFMVPFSRAAVPVVDRAQGRLVMDLHASGLADEPSGE